MEITTKKIADCILGRFFFCPHFSPFFSVFFPRNTSIRVGQGLGLGLGIGFMASYNKKVLVILEPHAGHKIFQFFIYRILYQVMFIYTPFCIGDSKK